MQIYGQMALTGKVQGELLTPAQPNEWGILVLGGSSGRVDIQRASLFANMGLIALALRWFGGSNQTPGICEVPLETFVDGIDELQREGCQRIAIIGTSKGAEAALLIATLDDRVQAVFAIGPSSVVWGNIGPDLMEFLGRSDHRGPGRANHFHLCLPTHPGKKNTRKDLLPTGGFSNTASDSLPLLSQ